MTEQMAIENINALNAVCWHKDFYDEEFARALATAIQALEEIQQYRAIGTVKEIKIREAQFARLSEGYLSDLTLLREYQSIGTVEELQALKERNMPKEAFAY